MVNWTERKKDKKTIICTWKPWNALQDALSHIFLKVLEKTTFLKTYGSTWLFTKIGVERQKDAIMGKNWWYMANWPEKKENNWIYLKMLKALAGRPEPLSPGHTGQVNKPLTGPSACLHMSQGALAYETRSAFFLPTFKCAVFLLSGDRPQFSEQTVDSRNTCWPSTKAEKKEWKNERKNEYLGLESRNERACCIHLNWS